jgi:hypothetical protein
VLSGGTSGKGDSAVHWTWNNPANNGRAIQRFEVSYDGGGWTSVGLANRYDRDTGGWDRTKNLKVRACSVACGPYDSANSTSGSDPAPPVTKVRVKQADNNSCPGKPGVPDRYNSAGPSCGGSDANWVSYSDGWIASSCWMNIYGSSETSNPPSYYKWYLMNGGPWSGWYVKLATIDISGPDVGRC